MDASGKNSFAVGGLLFCFLGVGAGFIIAQTVPPAPALNPSPATLTAPAPAAQAGPDFFRRLLAASAEDRETMLVGKSPKDRAVLARNLRKYDSMTPDERERSLRVLGLRFHLTTLMRLAPAERAGHLQQVPASERPLIEERLQIWDKISDDVRKTLLELEQLVRVSSFLVPAPTHGDGALSSSASNRLHQFEANLDRFKALSESKRTLIQGSFERLFDLPDPASARQEIDSLPLSPGEREQMEKTLKQFQSLPKPQRDTCIQNFRKLSQLPPEELRRFLRNAEEWQKMTPKDREEWRRVINNLPPFPPGMGQPPGPPLPPDPRAGSKSFKTATNAASP